MKVVLVLSDTLHINRNETVKSLSSFSGTKTESLTIENTEKIIEIISTLDENHISITLGAGDVYKIYDDQKLKLLLQI